jgi:hypothetical protein
MFAEYLWDPKLHLRKQDVEKYEFRWFGIVRFNLEILAD